MIYAGFINFSTLSITEKSLTKAIASFAQDAPSVIRKGALTLCCGKLSNTQDMDGFWENKSSILIGRAFDKERSSALAKTTFKDLSLLTTEAALNEIWGKYVYINVNKKNSQFEIVVDSTGQLPFFYYPFSDGNLLFASDMEILFKILGQKSEYNWEYLCSYLVNGSSSSIQTPFKNLFELPPACNLKITKNERETTPFWNPLARYKKSETQENDAVDVLQKTLKPWIEPYQTVCVSLSGGVDSSSLVYCLKDILKKDQTLKALNYFHSQIQSSNELIYARKVCEDAGIELIEVDASSSLPFDHSQQRQGLNPNKPFPGLVSLKWQETIFNNITSTNSVAFLSGHGSDHIFMRPPSQRCVSDYILEQGTKGSKEQLKSIAQFYRDPLFSIFKLNLKSLTSHFLGLQREKSYLKEKTKDLPKWIKKELLQNISPTYSHPIYEHLSLKVLPGKYDQIDALYEGLASIHVEMMNQTDPTFYPFLYEPVVEFALSFPTYALFEKGYDRYPLRKAVSDSFKTDTVWRRDKSQTTGLFQLGIKQNLERVLDICLNGHFAKQGLIDKEGLYKTITLIGNGDVKHLWPFMHLASAEIFLKYWEEKAL
ncbi:MAG TPA: asparagine synthase-related protein [Alphaproteobacteria bacterium]|nr:asparagine synthase-related protein [Alphaproteobacteria bacterium]